MLKTPFFKKTISVLLFIVAVSTDVSANMDSTPHKLYEESREKLLNQIAGEWVSHGIYAVTNLGIPDYLDNGPLHYTELARLSNTDPESLYRLLRMLSSNGIFYEDKEQHFSHTEKSRLLSTKHPSSLNAITRFYGGVIHQSWEGLQASLHSGNPGFEEHFGTPVFLYFKQNPQDFALFHAAMAEKSKAVIDSCLNNFDFSDETSVYDIGGGQGHFLWAILKKYPYAKGVLFDLPEVISKVKSEETNFQDRCTFISGDFFDTIPKGGDLYLLKSVIHDWNDEQSKIILSKCHEAMGDNSRLVIIEPILGGRNTPDYAKLMDVLMLNVTGGRERTMEDFISLLEETNFTIEKVIPTSTEFKMIVVNPKK